jgi:transcription initiation factor TFIIE subunit alpha
MTTLSQKEIDSLTGQLAGEDSIGVVRHILSKGENVSEFLIAEALDSPINYIRNVLYRLQENNLVTFTRKKDKKKGWYIYYWSFNHPQAVSSIKKMKESRIENLRKRLEREDSSFFYTCSSRCLRIKFEHALENNFKCSECSKVLKEVNNSRVIREIKKELSILEEVSEEEPSAIAEAAA